VTEVAGLIGGRSATLGVTVMKARRMRQLRQAELGRLIGVTRSTVSRIENDHETPRMNTLVLLSEVLELPYAKLLKLAGYTANGNRAA
jgi:transcriptional regulator with XRE-family HTH domain